MSVSEQTRASKRAVAELSLGVCVCVCACVRACVRACVCACTCVRVHAGEGRVWCTPDEPCSGRHNAGYPKGALKRDAAA